VTSDLFDTRGWRISPITEEEMMDCYQFGKKDAESIARAKVLESAAKVEKLLIEIQATLNKLRNRWRQGRCVVMENV
jgi:hypothetical protein